MISAHPSAGETVVQLGANDFISKPFDIDDLLKAVETNEVQSRQQLEAVTKDINKDINKLSSTTVIILEVNNY